MNNPESDLCYYEQFHECLIFWTGKWGLWFLWVGWQCFWNECHDWRWNPKLFIWFFLSCSSMPLWCWFLLDLNGKDRQKCWPAILSVSFKPGNIPKLRYSFSFLCILALSLDILFLCLLCAVRFFQSWELYLLEVKEILIIKRTLALFKWKVFPCYKFLHV